MRGKVTDVTRIEEGGYIRRAAPQADFNLCNPCNSLFELGERDSEMLDRRKEKPHPETSNRKLLSMEKWVTRLHGLQPYSGAALRCNPREGARLHRMPRPAAAHHEGVIWALRGRPKGSSWSGWRHARKRRRPEGHHRQGSRRVRWQCHDGAVGRCPLGRRRR